MIRLSTILHHEVSLHACHSVFLNTILFYMILFDTLTGMGHNEINLNLKSNSREVESTLLSDNLTTKHNEVALKSIVTNEVKSKIAATTLLQKLKEKKLKRQNVEEKIYSDDIASNALTKEQDLNAGTQCKNDSIGNYAEKASEGNEGKVDGKNENENSSFNRERDSDDMNFNSGEENEKREDENEKEKEEEEKIEKKEKEERHGGGGDHDSTCSRDSMFSLDEASQHTGGFDMFLSHDEDNNFNDYGIEID